MKGAAAATYSFSSAPKPVTGVRKKYREPGEDLTVYRDLKETCITWDRRVHRGNTYSAHHSQQPDAGAGSSLLSASAQSTKRRSRPKEPKIFDQPAPPDARIEVELSQHLIARDEGKPEVGVAEAQTDEFLPEPPPEEYVPQKTGVDASTQVEDGELFSFDAEVEPILEVIVSKTLEQSIMELEEEHEMEQMSIFKKQWQRRQEKMMADWQAQVEEEWARWHEKEKVMALKREEKLREARVLLKIQAVHSAKAHLAKVVPDAVASLQEVAFPDVRGQAINQVFLPALLGQVQEEVASVERARRQVADVVASQTQKRLDARARGLEAQREKSKVQEGKALEAAQRRRGKIRIHVDVGGGERVPVGPIQISDEESIEATQERVYSWLCEARPDLASSWPHGVLLCVAGEPVRSTAAIFDAGAGQISMVARPPPPPPEAAEEGGAGEEPEEEEEED